MAKSKKTARTASSKNSGFMSNFSLEEILPQKYHILAVILVILILFLIFLNPLYFGGKTFESGDIIASHSMQNYLNNHTDGYTLWNPLIFCGMPAYSIATGYKWFNLIYVGLTAVRSAFSSFFSVGYAMWSFYLILLAITSYLLMKYLTKNTLVSLFTALATSFSTGLIVFLYIGHVTKLTSICMYPLIFLLLFRMQEKFRLIDFLLMIISFQILLLGFHVQIIFYTLFAVGIYYLYFIISALARKDSELRKKILTSAGAFIVATVIALLIQSDNITQIYQYTPFSTRGGESIVEASNAKNNPSSSAYYDYHTMWSFSPGEMMTFVVPSYFGFGNSTYSGPLTQGREVDVNTYFGQMPFVDVAMYMGILVFFLGLFAIYSRWKEPMVRFLTVLTGIALLLSFGSNFPVLFNLLFYNLPYFNKFRVPSMILVLVQLSFPILAGLGLMKIISLREDKNTKLINLVKYLAFIFTGIFILSLLLGGSITDWFTGRVNDYAASLQSSRPQMARQFQALAGYTADMFKGDLLVAFALLSLTFWAAFGYVNSKISKDAFVIVVIVLTVFDLWRIDARGEKFVDNPDINNLFNKPHYISVIQNQKDKQPFRMLNLKQDGSLGSFNNNSNYNAYFMVEDFYGYSAIKPRAYQDLIDVIGPANPTLWNLANVKYIVADRSLPFAGLLAIDKSNKEIVYKNYDALPRAYFVDSVSSMPELDILHAIKNNSFDPKNKAYVKGAAPEVDPLDSTASVNIVKYADEEINMKVNASGNNFLFVGDTYFPVGWQAYIDGSKTKIYRTDHDFMGIVVPKGQHTVEFKYAPTTFYISKYIALILSSLVILGLIISILLKYKGKENSIPAEA